MAAHISGAGVFLALGSNPTLHPATDMFWQGTNDGGLCTPDAPDYAKIEFVLSDDKLRQGLNRWEPDRSKASPSPSKLGSSVASTVWYYQPIHRRLAGDSAEGKMCVVLPRPLGKGGGFAPPVASLQRPLAHKISIFTLLPPLRLHLRIIPFLHPLSLLLAFGLFIHWLHFSLCRERILDSEFAWKKRFAMSSWKSAMRRIDLPRRSSGSSCGTTLLASPIERPKRRSRFVTPMSQTAANVRCACRRQLLQPLTITPSYLPMS